MATSPRCDYWSAPRFLVRAADNAQQESDHRDDQQNVDDTSGMIAEEADSPDNEQDDGDGVQ